MLGALIVWRPASFWLQWTMTKGTVHLHGSSPCKVPNQTHRRIKKWKMHAIKQIKICAVYWDMLPRPRLGLSGTPGLRPISRPGSWQTSLGLDSMSQYSAQILICITIPCSTLHGCLTDKTLTASLRNIGEINHSHSLFDGRTLPTPMVTNCEWTLRI